MIMEGPWNKLLHPLSLTNSGRPELLDGEIECHLVEDADLEAEGSPPLRSGMVTFTTHRILWIDQKIRRGGFLPLPAISQIYPPKKDIKSMFFSAPRIRVEVYLTLEGTPSLQGHLNASSFAFISVVLRNQSGGDSAFLRLAEILRMKAWEKSEKEKLEKRKHHGPGMPMEPSTSTMQVVAGPSRASPAMAGLSGILRKEQEQWEETDKNLQEAFVDLNALMNKAKEMVVLAEKMRAKLLAAPNAQSSATEEEEFGSNQDMQDWMLSVGIVSPVTKETAGAQYHQQLSRQLADFVKVPLQRSGGMLSLVDVYCLFNRARGTELISPEDLLQACTIWTKIDVPVILRSFDSGVKVVQSKSQSDEEVILRIKTILSKRENALIGISASEAARTLGMAPALAKEQLFNAENKGVLCRDDGPDGLRFYLNFFKDVDVQRYRDSY